MVQLFLGVASYIERIRAADAPQPLPPVVEVTTAHVAVGALVLASSLLLTLQVFRNVSAAGRAVLTSTARQDAELAGPSRA